MRNPLDRGPRNRGGGKDLLRGHDVKYIYKRLFSYLSRHKLLLILASLLTVASSALSITGTSLAGSAIGAIAGEGEHSVFIYIGLMVVFYLLSFVISYVLALVMTRIAQRIAERMRGDIYSSLVKLPVGFFDKKQAGEIVSTVSYDVNTVDESLSHDFIEIIASLSTVIYSFVLMLFISPVLVMVFCVTIPLSILFTSIVTRIVRPLFRKRSASLGELNGYVEEMVAGQKTIRVYGAEDSVIEGFDKRNENARNAYIKAEANGTMGGPVVNFINNLSLALVNIVGAILFMSGGPVAITLTGLSQFILLSRKFSGPINQIANIYSDIQSAVAASERVFKLIDETKEAADKEGAKPLLMPKGRVEFKDVSFGYTPDAKVLHNLSFTAEEGSVTAIVGHTGAGKTTIINLLMRFYDISSGAILIDGERITDYTMDSLRQSFTMVLQDTWLFSGTVAENIAYGRDDVTREDIIRVSKLAGVHNFIASLPSGYDTGINESGVNISKGQKQLLTIARAMLIDSKMLILDEATSNVDSKTERDISDAMIKLMQGKTCFVIAHRLSTVENADRILVLEDGDVKEIGTHSELLAKKGKYFEIYNAQFDTAMNQIPK